MASKGECRVAITGHNDLVFTWVAVQSRPCNSSVICWMLELEADSVGGIRSGEEKSWAVTVGDQTFAGQTGIGLASGTRKTLATDTVTILHDGEGAADFTYSFRLACDITLGSVQVGTVSGSGAAALDPISLPVRPVTVDSAVLGSALYIGLEGRSDMQCDVFWSFAGASGTVAEGVSHSVQWIPPLTLAERIPDATWAVAEIRCESQLGSAVTTLELTVPENLQPRVDLSWEDTSGAFRKLGTPVQNVSALDVRTVAAGVYGSTIRSVRVLLDGKPYDGGVITQPGEHVLEGICTDSRGITARVSCPLTVAAYKAPWLTLSASRCREDGSPDDTGEFARVSLLGTVTDLDGRNTAELRLYYGGAEETAVVAPGAVAAEWIIPAPSAASMTLRGVLRDSVMHTERSMVLSTGYATLDLLAGGRGIALGTTATREGFECAMPAFFTGGVEGAAPDGFGIGSDGTSRITALTDYNDGVKTGFYVGSGAGTRNAPVPQMAQGTLAVQAGVWGVYQLLRWSSLAAERYYTPGSGWESWQWISPPMEAGLEYKTNRYFLGRPVYTMLVDFGYLPDNGTRTIPLGELGFVVGVRGVICTEALSYPLVMGHEGNLGAYFFAGSNSLGCRTMADLSGYRAYVTVEYTR